MPIPQSCEAETGRRRAGARPGSSRQGGSQSFARRRHPVRAKVRSTIRRRGGTAKPFASLGLSTTSVRCPERPACRSRVCGFGPERPPSATNRAGVGAASITSGAPSRSRMSAGCTFMVIGDNSTPVTAWCLRPWLLARVTALRAVALRGFADRRCRRLLPPADELPPELPEPVQRIRQRTVAPPALEPATVGRSGRGFRRKRRSPAPRGENMPDGVHRFRRICGKRAAHPPLRGQHRPDDLSLLVGGCAQAFVRLPAKAAAFVVPRHGGSLSRLPRRECAGSVKGTVFHDANIWARLPGAGRRNTETAGSFAASAFLPRVFKASWPA